jgi:hypothetical protein
MEFPSPPFYLGDDVIFAGKTNLNCSIGLAGDHDAAIRSSICILV